MDYPTKLYPSAPKPEWFMNHASNFHTLQTGVSSLGDAKLPPTYFAKMDASQFSLYLEAHDAWLKFVRNIAADEHHLAEVRRALTKVKVEAIVWRDPKTKKIDTMPAPVLVPQPAQSLEALIVYKKKDKQQPPVVSVKPHQAEKRANKKKHVDAITKAKAASWEAKSQAILETATVAKIKDTEIAVKNITANNKLRKVEEVAAKSAATRAKAIRFGSTDVVTNVVPEDGWKVVTRKRGSNLAVVEEITKTSSANQTVDKVTTRREVGGGKFSAVSAVRNPTSVKST